MTQIDLEKIQIESDKFIKEREREKFHTPKNLVIGISIEASDLIENKITINTKLLKLKILEILTSIKYNKIYNI